MHTKATSTIGLLCVHKRHVGSREHLQTSREMPLEAYHPRPPGKTTRNNARHHPNLRDALVFARTNRIAPLEKGGPFELRNEIQW